MTLIYSVGFNQNVEFLCKILHEKIKPKTIDVIGRVNFGAKTQDSDCYKLLEITESICYFYGSLSYVKNQHHI